MTDLLLPYTLTTSPAAPAHTGELSLHHLQLAVGSTTRDSAAPTVRCSRLTLTLPTAPAVRMPMGEPVILRTKVEAERGPRRGRQWTAEAITTDPAATVIVLEPVEPADFDGTWTLTLTVSISTPLDGTVRITEDTTLVTDTGAGPTPRTGTVSSSAA
ncbi:hypothetical protein [Streptomyces orinoci]|uniref:Uncharacterized protein n=1 Tax=Streptomyces orinoci TaxID=67339 RepID=A0ABV3JZ61_STRON|nr:hypothetical protein [Streptomyces orinoci]